MYDNQIIFLVFYMSKEVNEKWPMGLSLSVIVSAHPAHLPFDVTRQ